ncbi:(d)CMP kinase [Patescibacteria group bacterium]
MIISISGKPGSGKSTVAEKLAAALGYERVYIGKIRRDAARKKGMTLAEFNTWSESNEEGDKEFDEYIAKLGREKDNIVIESRTAFHFIPHSLKIFLDVSNEEGARRIWRSLQDGDNKSRNEAKALDSYEAVLASVEARLKSDILRYQKYYKIDIFDPSHYDLFVDTTKLSQEEEFNRVVSFVQRKIQK